MPKVTDLIAKFEKAAAETQAPAYGKKTVKTEPKAEVRVNTDQAASEKPIVKRSGRALPTPPARKGRPLPPFPSKPSARKTKILDTLQREEALKKAFVGPSGAENPMMKALHTLTPKKVFESIKTMMASSDPEAPTKIDENLFGTTAQAFFKTDYKNLTPTQKDFVQKHNGEKAFDIEAAADAVIKELESLPEFLEYQEVILKAFTLDNQDSLRNAICVLDFKQSVKEGDSLATAFNEWLKVLDQIWNPRWIEFESLRVKEIRHNYNLTMIPPQVFQMEELESLAIRSAFISALPPEIEHLQNLQYLSINYTPLSHLPDEIGRLTNLTSLDLSDLYHLSQLPDTIGDLSNLERLNLRFNKKLSSLPLTIEKLRKLKFLDIRDTGIMLTPSVIGSLTSLTDLALNKASSRSLPESIVNLTNLRWLTFSSFYLDQLSPKQREWLLTLSANGCTITQE